MNDDEDARWRAHWSRVRRTHDTYGPWLDEFGPLHGPTGSEHIAHVLAPTIARNRRQDALFRDLDAAPDQARASALRRACIDTHHQLGGVLLHVDERFGRPFGELDDDEAAALFADLARWHRADDSPLRAPNWRNSWGITFMCMFDMAGDSHLFRTAAELEAAGGELGADGRFYLPAGEDERPEPGGTRLTPKLTPAAQLALFDDAA